jgi:hypothetical protein
VADVFLEVETPLGFSVRCTQQHWDSIVRVKHPAMVGREGIIRQVLEDPEEIRKSRKDERVLLFYRRQGERYFSAVVRRPNGDAFLITTYPTDAIKAGEVIWTRSK